MREFFGSSRTNVVASILQFPAIDTDGMIKKLRLKDRAREQGKKDLPPSDSESLDATEQQIVNEIQNEGKTQFSAYLSHQKTYAERAGDTGIMALAQEYAAVTPNAKGDFDRQTGVGIDELYALRRDVIEAERELKNFRDRHTISRPARDIGSRAYKIGALILILAVESVMNGFFLSKGNVFGLIGGVAEAFIIAAINVFVGVAIGRVVLPWLRYRNWFIRLLAALASITYLAAAAGFNLAVAHYRNAVVADPFEASVVAYHSVTMTPFAIADLQSWSLFLLGLIFSLIAAYDGFRMDDPYPGYGQCMRQSLDALADYTDRKDELFGDLETVKKVAEAKLRELTDRMESRKDELSNVVARSQALRAEIIQHFGHLESAANTLLSVYRDENRAARKTRAPDRFDQRWSYEAPALGPDIAPSQTPAVVQEQLAQLFADGTRHRDELNDAYRRALAAYRAIDDLVE